MNIAVLILKTERRRREGRDNLLFAVERKSKEISAALKKRESKAEANKKTALSSEGEMRSLTL